MTETAVVDRDDAVTSPVRERIRGRLQGTSSRTVGVVALLALVAGAAVASIAIGAKPIGVGVVTDALTSFDAANDDHLIVRELRVPRTLLALLVGGALGLAGAVMQGVTRNPLADPGLLGVNAGAALAVVTSIYVIGVGSVLGTAWFALGGAAVAGLTVYVLGSAGRGGATPVKLAIAGAALGAVSCIVLVDALWITVGPFTIEPSPTVGALIGSVVAVAAIYLLAIRGGLSSYRLVLIGIGITAMLDAGIAYLLTRAQLYQAQQATIWLTGSLNGRSWDHVRPLTIALAVLVPVILLTGRQLRVMEMGDDAASGLGVSLHRSKAVLALSAAGLAAVATAAAGPVGFVALVAPQISRRLTGARTAGFIPAGLVGAAIVVAADLLARRTFAPTELPVGVVTAVVGAPYLLWLLARANRIGSGG